MRWESSTVPAAALIDHFGGPQPTAACLGVHIDTTYRWMGRDRQFTLWEADRWAIRGGTYPFLVWPEWFTLPDKRLVTQ